MQYLQDSEARLFVRGHVLQVHGSPASLTHAGSRNAAFVRDSEDALAVHWCTRVPSDADVVVTHQPLWEHEGGVVRHFAGLAAALAQKRPRLHLCGHSHAAHGAYSACGPPGGGGFLSVNAAVLGRGFRVQYPPVVVDLPLKSIAAAAGGGQGRSWVHV